MDTPRPPVVLRHYVADSYGEALDAYEVDLVSMASADWFPGGQSWGWDAIGSIGFSSAGPAGNRDRASWR